MEYNENKYIYHKETKDLFLDDIKNENTKKAYEVLFAQISKSEQLYTKDIFDFNIEELKSCLELLQKTTIISVATTVSKIVNYWKWALNPGKFTKNIEPLSWLMSKKVEDLVSSTALENSYISEEEMYSIIEKEVRNNADAGLILLLYRGVCGYEMSELINLETNNINFDNNTIKIIGTVKINKEIIDSSRILTLSDRDMGILKLAVDSKIYIKGEGEDKKIYNFLESPYIFKNFENTKAVEGDKISYSQLSSRIKTVFKNHYKPQINAQKIIYSAMLNELQKIKQEKNNLEKEDYIKVLDSFYKNSSNVKVNTLKKTYNLLLEKGII